MHTQIKLNRVLAGLALTASMGYSAASSATLVNNGNGLIYDTALNATWTQDANLLGTLENTQGYSTIVNAIIAAVPVIHDTPNQYDNGGSGIYHLSASDFGGSGLVNWWGAQAYVGYLNSIAYKGSTQWALPSAGSNPQIAFQQTGSQLGELFYNELGGVAGSSMPSGPFSHVQTYAYWSGTEYASVPYYAWDFDALHGGQYNYFKGGSQFYAWAVSPGNVAVSAVPIPGAFWLFGSALTGFIGFNRRKA